MADTARVFTRADQAWFATLSGDANPIHVDALAARRTLAGRPAVHGVHTLLWALERMAAASPGQAAPGAIRADFAAFLPAGQPAALDARSRRATVSSEGVTVLTLELRDETAAGGPPIAGEGPALAPEAPLALGLAALAGRRGLVACPPDDAAAAAFPQACGWLGAGRVAGLLACTRLVGMVCPGLHSIFNRLELSLAPARAEGLAWRVAAVDDRFRRVRLNVSGAGLAGSLVASVRHEPVRQLPMEQVAGRVAPAAFAGATALVVGGSRGLGELTAKLLAAGGADVVATYATGRSDAEQVAEEIGRFGGRCRVLPYDAGADAAAQLEALAGTVTHAYYYATTPIFAASARLFDPARLHTFLNVYVHGFDRLVQALWDAGPRPLGLFYPSSVAVAERPPGMAEYAMAKAAGEILCEEVGRRRDPVRVTAARLPRLATDQTATLAGPRTAPAIDVILPLVLKVQAHRA